MKPFTLFIYLFFYSSLTFAVMYYPVVEPDPLKEITQIAKSNSEHFKFLLKKYQQKVFKYSATNLLPAKRSFSYSFKPIYCLNHDIKVPIRSRNDILGWKILYKKDYCFNPLDYLLVKPPPMIIFSPSEIDYVEKKLYPKYPNALYILSNVDVSRVKSIAKHSFLKNIHYYFLSDYIKRKLHLKYTISIVKVSKNKIEIQVIKVNKNINETKHFIHNEVEGKKIQGANKAE